MEPKEEKKPVDTIGGIRSKTHLKWKSGRKRLNW